MTGPVALLTTDWHLESGASLGHADAELGNTRLADARRILNHVCKHECNVLVFLGDLARNARPGPTAYSIAVEALRSSPAAKIILLKGNHDHAPGAYSCLDVLARALGPRAQVVSRPEVVESGELQIGCLPWAPTANLFARTDGSIGDVNRAAARALEGIARGLAAELDPERPAILVAHWLLAGQRLAGDISVMESREPVPSAYDLESSGNWTAIFGGHNHRHQMVGDRSWAVGPPMRGGFDDEDVATGYMRCEFEAPGIADIEHVPVSDRPMVTIELDAEAIIAGTFKLPDNLQAAIVRLKGEVTETQAEALNAGGGRLMREVARAPLDAGAHKVIGSAIKVVRERRVRSDLTADADPRAALDRYLDSNDIDRVLRPLVVEEAERIMG